MMNRSCLSVASRARTIDRSYFVAAMPARIKIIVTTIIISSNENPAAKMPRRADHLRRFAFRVQKTAGYLKFIQALPVGIFCSIGGRRLGLRIHVKNVVTTPAVGIRIILHSAQAPVG